jgi:hypothetical protein
VDTGTIEASCEMVLVGGYTKKNVRKPIIPIDKVGWLVYDVHQIKERRRRYVTGNRIQTKYRYVLSNVYLPGISYGCGA